ncbi:acyl carrier protein [Sphingomonas bacterium]|uniref:acyl carrier protein n=1 Tax=Sphingomonas bacterium TaxID=1895847 RepID=UPI001575CCF6|nr:phosphopantetheine-binding protein [Sphingomonas bacterium]
MAATTRDQLVDLVVDALGCAAGDVTDAATMATLGADSLDMIEVLACAEDDCRVTITDEEVEALATFGDLIALVERKRVPA